MEYLNFTKGAWFSDFKFRQPQALQAISFYNILL